MARRLRIGHPLPSTYSLQAAYAAYVLSGQAAGLTYSAASGGDSITSDAYSDYTTFHLDLSNGSDSNNGLTEGTAKRTWSAATALLTSPGSRLLVKGSGALTQDVTLPASGTSDDARIVVMGYPEHPMPVITLGSYGFTPSANGEREFITFRKMHLTGGVERHAIDLSENNSTNYFTAEYMRCDNMRREFDDNQACIDVDGAVTGLIVRYSKFGDNKLNSGEWYRNGTAILAYNLADAQIYNNEFFDCYFVIRWKEPPPDGHGPKIYRNIIHNTEVAIGIHDDNGVEGGFSGLEISGNLFYNVTRGILELLDEEDTDGFLVSGNTFGHDVFGGLSFMSGSGIRVTNNVFAADDLHLQSSYYQNEDGNNPPIRFSEIDYNAYLGGEWKLGVYLNTATERTYSSLEDWQEAKTTHNHPDLSELEAANPDLNSVSFSSLSDTFVDHENRDYTLKATSSLKGAGKGGIDPGYDPDNCGPGW